MLRQARFAEEVGLDSFWIAEHHFAEDGYAAAVIPVQVPPVEKAGAWVDALRLMRLMRAKSGVIEGNILRGGMIEFFDGPWRIVDNDFRGTPPGSSSHTVFGGHGTHDVLVRGNKTRSDGKAQQRSVPNDVKRDR